MNARAVGLRLDMIRFPIPDSPYSSWDIRFGGRSASILERMHGTNKRSLMVIVSNDYSLQAIFYLGHHCSQSVRRF